MNNNDAFRTSVNSFITSLIKKDYSQAEKKLQDCMAEKIKERISATIPQK